MAFSIHPESPNKRAIPLVEHTFREHEAKLRELLPELTNDLQLYVYDENIIPETGTGGYAYSPTILSLAIDNDFNDKERQRNALIGTMFHESYHLVQGHTGNEPQALYLSALDSAVYEGCATVFEREYTNEEPLWGNYSMHSEVELQGWREALANISPDDWLKDDGALWQRWSFYDEDDGERWKAYKVGVWIVESYLQKTGKDIRDLRRMTARDIYGATTLIVIRGNSGSGKSTVAKRLQHEMGYNTMLVQQDVVRREILRTRDTPGNPAIQLIYDIAAYGRSLDNNVIVEGIMPSDRYAAMLQRLATLFDETLVYYFDIPFEETLRRHSAKPNAHEFGEKEMKKWWIERDLLGDDDVLITHEQSEEEIVQQMLRDVGFRN